LLSSSQEGIMHMVHQLHLQGVMHMYHPAILRLHLAKALWHIGHMTTQPKSNYRILKIPVSVLCGAVLIEL